jgi:probable HAF family extracellular repeat protein
MKSKRLTCIIAMTLLAVAMPVSLAAQDKAKQNHPHQYHHYQLVDVGTFGGPQSALSNPLPQEDGLLNNRGAIVGIADTTTPDPFAPNCMTDCYVAHAFRWEDGNLTDLGALPGDNSSYAFWTSNSGLTIGVSENGAIDALTGYPETDAVLWGQGQIIDLGTLGGNGSSPSAVNARGQVVGAALNTIPDSFQASPNPFPPTFLFPVATQMHAFLWDGAMHDLGTLGGPDSAAFYVNDPGQVAGCSYTNSTPNPTTGTPTLDPFLWEHGKMRDLGTLGGTVGYPNAINERGQVVGQSNLAGDQTAHPFLSERGKKMIDLGTLGGSYGTANWINEAGEIVGISSLVGDGSYPAFLWKDGVMENLGTVDGDPCSDALGINAKGQVVGASWDCGPEYIRAFLWENGAIFDLNNLVPPGSGVQLRQADSINDRGEIAIQGVLANGDLHAILLIPCDENHPRVEGCDYSMVEATAAARVQAPQVGRTPSGAMHNGITIALPGRLQGRTARR